MRKLLGLLCLVPALAFGQYRAPAYAPQTFNTGTNATVPVYGFLLPAGVGTNADASVVPAGTGAFQLAVPDGTVLGGNKRGANAVDLQGPSQRAAATQVASGVGSFAAGYGNTAAQTYGITLGFNNNITGGAGSVAIGSNNSSPGNSALLLGTSNTVTGGNIFFVLGTGNALSGSGNTNGVAIGTTNTVNALYGVAIGRNGTVNGVTGQVVYGHGSPTLGQYQHTLTQVFAATTSTAATIATADGASGATSNQLTLRNNSVFYVRARVVARDATNNTDAAAWYADLLVTRGATAATIAIVGSPTVTQQYATTGAVGWTVAFAVDTTNGALKATVTSTTTDTVRWNTEYDAIEVM